ncbi:hypothetical protein, partial [Marinomonas arenicola]
MLQSRVLPIGQQILRARNAENKAQDALKNMGARRRRQLVSNTEESLWNFALSRAKRADHR